MSGGPDPLYVRARAALLDAAEALAEQLDAFVLVGAQAKRDELIRLGKRAKPDIRDEHAALREGATQFKANFTQLREVIRESAWAKQNILVAVAGGRGDGTSGVP